MIQRENKRENTAKSKIKHGNESDSDTCNDVEKGDRKDTAAVARTSANPSKAMTVKTDSPTTGGRHFGACLLA